MKESEENLTAEDRDAIETLQNEYGLRYVQNGELFYKLYKISRKDFAEKLG